jgi:hypothetical protein
MFILLTESDIASAMGWGCVFCVVLVVLAVWFSTEVGE